MAWSPRPPVRTIIQKESFMTPPARRIDREEFRAVQDRLMESLDRRAAEVGGRRAEIGVEPLGSVFTPDEYRAQAVPPDVSAREFILREAGRIP